MEIKRAGSRPSGRGPAEYFTGAVRQDPDWIAAREASEKEGGGSLTVPDGVKSVYLKATDFSPTK